MSAEYANYRRRVQREQQSAADAGDLGEQRRGLLEVLERPGARLLVGVDDHLGDNGRDGTPLFQPMPRAESFFPVDKRAGFALGLGTAVGEPGQDYLTYSGPDWCAVGRAWGTQFHPEKSSHAGIALLRNWLSTLPRTGRLDDRVPEPGTEVTA